MVKNNKFRTQIAKHHAMNEIELAVFIEEVKYLQSIKATITSDDISMLLRDLTSSYPK